MIMYDGVLELQIGLYGVNIFLCSFDERFDECRLDE